MTRTSSPLRHPPGRPSGYRTFYVELDGIPIEIDAPAATPLRLIFRAALAYLRDARRWGFAP